MLTHSETLTLTATEYRAKVEAKRAPILAELAEWRADLAGYSAALAGTLTSEDRHEAFSLAGEAEEMIDYCLHIMPEGGGMYD